MKTSKEFNKNLKNGIVTTEMLGAAIYSFNKRAKNYRDNMRELIEQRRWADWWEKKYIQRSIDDAEYKKDEYYGYKDYLLSFVSPIQIHHCQRWNERRQESIDEYFQLFQVADYRFHHPITEAEAKKSNLDIEELPSDFSTEGEDIEDLISVQFATKVVRGLKDGTLRIAA